MTTRNAASMGTYGATWEHGGYAGQGPVSEIVNSLAGRPAVVCGNASGVFEEQVDVLLKYPDAIIFAVNDVGMFLPKLDHWVSLHAPHLAAWKMTRWLQPRASECTKYHSVDSHAYIDHVWTGLTPLFALSGYFAMQIAYIMGASPIILVGCPGNATRRFFEAAPRPDFSYGAGSASSDNGVRVQIEHEMKRLPEFKAKVRSQSGWTREFFGSL